MEHKNLIAGEWAASGSVTENINPSDTNDVIGCNASGDAAQMRDAIQSAADAFKAWSQSGIQQRFDCLDRIGTEILARKDELGLLLAREQGKTLPEAIGEVGRAGDVGF